MSTSRAHGRRLRYSVAEGTHTLGIFLWTVLASAFLDPDHGYWVQHSFAVSTELFRGCTTGRTDTHRRFAVRRRDYPRDIAVSEIEHRSHRSVLDEIQTGMHLGGNEHRCIFDDISTDAWLTT
eukprot:6207569-Pleurochrysis_carterae.AAC.1